MALLTPRPDGSWLIETRLDHFLEAWKASNQDDRLVLIDLRPAVRTRDDQGISIKTVHPIVWDQVRHIIKPLLKGGLHHPSRARLCQFCGTEMKVKRELTDAWVFRCDVCKSSEIHGKRLIGGTIGQGDKEVL